MYVQTIFDSEKLYHGVGIIFNTYIVSRREEYTLHIIVPFDGTWLISVFKQPVSNYFYNCILGSSS